MCHKVYPAVLCLWNYNHGHSWSMYLAVLLSSQLKTRLSAGIYLSIIKSLIIFSVVTGCGSIIVMVMLKVFLSVVDVLCGHVSNTGIICHYHHNMVLVDIPTSYFLRPDAFYCD
jgi:hypothetical protein